MPILEALGAHAGVEVVRQFARAGPRGIAQYKWKRFFGPGAVSLDDVRIVLDNYDHPLPRNQARYIKRMLGRKPDVQILGEDTVVGVSTARALSYALSAFAVVAEHGRIVKLERDSDVANLWDGTFICFGSPDSNVKTYDVMELTQQRFVEYDFASNGTRKWRIGNRSFGVEPGLDHGILLRMYNPHSPKHLLFVCAGIGEWGSTGSAWTLFSRWKELHKQHGKKEFCLVVKVTAGSDQSAVVVHTAS